MINPTTPAPDGALPSALHQLGQAISALTDDKPETRHLDNGDTRIEWIHSLYHQLAEAVHGDNPTENVGVSKSRSPIFTAAVDTQTGIDRTVREWEPHWPIPLPALWPFPYEDQYPTVQRLHLIEKRRWRPQDVHLIQQYTAVIDGWCSKIRELFDTTRRWTLPNPCPSCDTKVVYRTNTAGEKVRTPALQIGPDGCQCQHCRYVWEPAYYIHLARVLGYAAVPGVLE